MPPAVRRDSSPVARAASAGVEQGHACAAGDGCSDAVHAAPGDRTGDQPTTLPRWAPAAPLGALVAAGVGAVYLAGHNPADGGAYLRCPFFSATGRWCPGCGLTRATYHLVHADVAAALSSNVFVVFAVVAAVTGWWAWWQRSRGKPGPTWWLAIPGWAWGAFTAAFVAFGVVRNFPAFAVLAP